MLVLVGVSNWSRNLPCVRIMFEALCFHAHVLLQQHLGPYIPCIIYMECYVLHRKQWLSCIYVCTYHFPLLSQPFPFISFHNHLLSPQYWWCPILWFQVVDVFLFSALVLPTAVPWRLTALSTMMLPTTVLLTMALWMKALSMATYTFNDGASNGSGFDNGTLNEGTFNGNIHFQRWCFQRQWFWQWHFEWRHFQWQHRLSTMVLPTAVVLTMALSVNASSMAAYSTSVRPSVLCLVLHL